jgi:hypothetical protein
MSLPRTASVAITIAVPIAGCWQSGPGADDSFNMTAALTRAIVLHCRTTTPPEPGPFTLYAGGYLMAKPEQIVPGEAVKEHGWEFREYPGGHVQVKLPILSVTWERSGTNRCRVTIKTSHKQGPVPSATYVVTHDGDRYEAASAAEP